MARKALSTKKRRASTCKSRAALSTKAIVRKIRNDIKAKKPKAQAKKAPAAQKGGWVSDSGTRKKGKKSCKSCTKLEWWA